MSLAGHNSRKVSSRITRILTRRAFTRILAHALHAIQWKLVLFYCQRINISNRELALIAQVNLVVCFQVSTVLKSELKSVNSGHVWFRALDAQ